jgi:nucleoside-diphosphate-sugar epimerase
VRALVFGASGQIGTPLLARLRAARWEVDAVSRGARANAPGLRWLRGDLAHCDGLPAGVDAIFSCGPLDHFSRWYATCRIDAARVVAFGSTSATAKAASGDAHERDLARRLREGEEGVFAAARARGAAATLLRPTLVYGAGRDRTLARIAGFARRRRWMVLPSVATGLRQPVHVDDLAEAAMRACDAPASHGRGYDLPGGETLPYREMVARMLAAMRPPARLLELPAPWFAAALAGARWLGKAEGIGDAAIGRLRENLVFDAGPAARDFGYAPRRFDPVAAAVAARDGD